LKLFSKSGEPIRILRIAFPHRKDTPACGLKSQIVPSIPLEITFQLRLPKVAAAFWQPSQFACRIRVSVPKATMHENDRATRQKNHVGTARQSPVMEPVAKPGGMKETAHAKFRLRVFMPDQGHLPTAGGADLHSG
jgi:hypothetical protein